MDTKSDARPLLTVDDVARRLTCSRSTVYRHATTFGGFHLGGQLRFDPERLDRWIAERIEVAEQLDLATKP